MESLPSTGISGHLGRDKTYETVRRRFYWPGIANDVKLWCQSCVVCARTAQGHNSGTLISISISITCIQIK